MLHKVILKPKFTFRGRPHTSNLLLFEFVTATVLRSNKIQNISVCVENKWTPEGRINRTMCLLYVATLCVYLGVYPSLHSNVKWSYNTDAYLNMSTVWIIMMKHNHHHHYYYSHCSLKPYKMIKNTPHKFIFVHFYLFFFAYIQVVSRPTVQYNNDIKSSV